MFLWQILISDGLSSIPFIRLPEFRRGTCSLSLNSISTLCQTPHQKQSAALIWAFPFIREVPCVFTIIVSMSIFYCIHNFWLQIDFLVSYTEVKHMTILPLIRNNEKAVSSKWEKVLLSVSTNFASAGNVTFEASKNIISLYFPSEKTCVKSKFYVTERALNKNVLYFLNPTFTVWP
jgi:hypothetical protein